MPRMKKTLAVVLALAATLAFTGCSAASRADDGAHTKRVTFLTVTPTCDYCARQAQAFRTTMQKAGVQVTSVTTNFDVAEQAQQINQAISTRPDAIVIWPADASAVVPGLARIKQVGIPVVVSTSIPDTKDRSLWAAFTGPNNVSLGESSARALVAGLQEKGLGTDGAVLEVTGTAGADSTIGRTNGFKQELAKIAPKLKIVGSQPGNWDQTTATTAAAALFSQYGNQKIIGLYGEADNMLAGAITAAQRAGYKPGSNLVAVGSDCTIEGYTNITSGKQYATNLQDPAKDGQNVAAATLKVLGHESVPKVAWMKTPLITKQNLSTCASAVGK